jgi:predicted hydrocarbon binding protein
MDRKDFFKKSCQAGLCVYAGFTVLNQSTILATETNSAQNADDWRIGFMQKRYAKPIDILNSNLDENTRDLILENLGRACSKESEKERLKFKGDIEGFLNEIKNNWAENVSYDKEKGEIRIVGKKVESCFCPFAGDKSISNTICNCSLGWQKETLESVIGKPVKAKIESSFLRGGDRCSFSAQVL